VRQAVGIYAEIGKRGQGQREGGAEKGLLPHRRIVDRAKKKSGPRGPDFF
jgi:hypothetical protein